MSNITVFSQNNGVVSSHLVTLLSGRKVSEATDMELDVVITFAIEKANLDLGRSNIDESDNDHLCNTLMTEARKCFSTLTLDELKEAIENGTKGKYNIDPIYKPTVILVITWWNAWMQDAKRIEARKQINNEVYISPTEEQKKELNIQIIKNSWAKYKKDGKVGDIGNAVYNSLDELELIPFSIDRKLEFMELAKKSLLSEYSTAKTFDKIKRMELQNIIDSILAGNEKSRLKAEAKRIALNTFFKELLEVEMEIEELLP